jgi:hypothetical protein
LLSHPPLGSGDLAELQNLSPVPASIGGWFLTDDLNAPWKFPIPGGTTIPAGGFMVFYASNSFGANGINSFALGAKGDQVYLFSGDGVQVTGYAHGFAFDAAASGVTFGRYVTSTGEEQFPGQRLPTPGAPNAGPRVGTGCCICER